MLLSAEHTTDTKNWRARLAVSVDVMRELSRYTDPEAMYQVFARRMNGLYPTARQISLCRQGFDPPGFRVTRFNLWQNPANPHKERYRLPAYAGGVLAEVLYADEPRVIDDLDLAPDDPAAEFLDGQRSLLSIPLYERGAAATTLVVTREQPHAFRREQIPELVWMTNLFARAVQTLVLSEQLNAAVQAADYDAKVIADIQQGLLPAAVPAVEGLDVAAHYRPVRRAGGDLYDFFPLPNNRLGVLVADVSGHGSGAAVLMAITHSLAHSYPHAPADPGAFLSHLNRHLAGKYTGAAGAFVTAFYAVFDPDNGLVTYANAGHPAPLVGRPGAAAWEPLPGPQRLPLGVSARDEPYPYRAAPLRPGDKVALFTDGLTDALDRKGDAFGPAGIDGSQLGPASARDVVDGVLAALDRFTDGVPVADDRTLVVVGRV